MKSILLMVSLFCFSIANAGTVNPNPVNCEKEETYPIISKADLKKVADDKSAFIVDVNSAESFKDAHVPGAIHYGDHKKDFETLLPADKSKMIVAYCGGPQCTAWFKAAEIACKKGYTNIYHFKDGISGWKKM